MATGSYQTARCQYPTAPGLAIATPHQIIKYDAYNIVEVWRDDDSWLAGTHLRLSTSPAAFWHWLAAFSHDHCVQLSQSVELGEPLFHRKAAQHGPFTVRSSQCAASPDWK
jgi:hypothetical protein